MTERDAIVHEMVYPHPIELVWEAITQPEQIASWLMTSNFNAEVGHHFTFFDHEPWPDGQILDIHCEVIACQPPHRLSYTWASPPKLGKTLVSWQLEEIDGGTRVCLTHSGFARHGKAGSEAVDVLEQGWGGLLREELWEHLQARALARNPESYAGHKRDSHNREGRP